MAFHKLNRLLSTVLALCLAMMPALAEEAEWAEASGLGAEAPLEDVLVPEMAEAPLPGDPAGDPLPEEGAGEQAVSAALWEPEQTPSLENPEPAPVPEAILPVLAVNEVTLGAKETFQLTLAGGVDPISVGAVFTSLNPKIAAVDAATGALKGRKVGSATVVLEALGVQSACEVTVLKAPRKITLSARELRLGIGEDTWLLAGITPNTASAITYSSSNPEVVTVDNTGHLLAVGGGSATITVTTFNRKKASCKVGVLAAPEYIALTDGVINLWQGRACDLKPILSPGSGGGLYSLSSDPSVVSVDGTTIRGEGLGTATVTVTTYNGLSASATVHVTRAPSYRALLVGECHFPGTGMASLPGDKDVALLSRMLNSVTGPSGNPWAVSGYTDLTAAQIHDAIQSAFAGATEGDVSLFYISTHGDQDQTFEGDYPEFAGYLQTYPDYNYEGWYQRNALTLVGLAYWLSEVPGQVVVLIDSCGSGAAIYNAKGIAAPPLSPEAFDGAVVEAFQEVDRGVMAPGVDQGAFVLENKFFVLTSTAYRETGWSLKGKYSYFSKWLSDSVKTRRRMPADADRNGITTLHELYTCMAKLAGKKVFRYAGGRYRQHVQVYPSYSGFELFCRAR